MKKVAFALASVFILASVGAAFAQEYDTRTLRAIGEGRALYVQRCAACHGPLAQGLSNVPTGTDGITCSAPDLTKIKDRDGRFDRLHVRVHIEGQASGKCAPGMPCWQQVLRQSVGGDAYAFMQTYRLVKYVEWLQEHEQQAVAAVEPMPE